MISKSKIFQANVLIPAVSLVVLLVYVISALKLAPPMIDGVLSESFFPLMVFLIGTPAAVVLLFDGLREGKREKESGEETAPAKMSIKPVLIVLDIVFFIVAFHFLGFVLVAPLYVFLFMLIYDDKPGEFLKKIIFSVIISILVYILYVVLFDIRFPGIWS